MSVFMARGRVEVVEEAPSVNYVDYLESSGTQYINTGFKNNQDTRIVVDAQVVKSPSANAWLFGGKNSTTVGARNVFLLNGKTWSVDYNSDATRKGVSGVGILDRLHVDFDKNVITINGKTQTFDAATFQCKYDHYLLAQNKVGEVSGYISARLYSCQIYDNGVIVRDYWPCYDPDGVACLYDRVNKEYVYNAGKGDFVAGMDEEE